MSDAVFLEAALALARSAAEADEVPVGAVIVRNGAIVSRGANFRERIQSPLSHAEIHAIAGAAGRLGSWRLNECDLYVTLEPCPMCLGAMHQARIRRCVYGAADPKGGALSLGYRLNEDTRTNHRFPVELSADDRCGKILTDFFRRKRERTE